MNNFEYYTPTRVIFGKESEKEAGRIIKKKNYKKVLLHYGNSAVKSGLIGRIRESLAQEGVVFTELGGVTPNPKLPLVHEGICICRREKVDFILAVGGGSVIDSSKAIAIGTVNDVDIWDIFKAGDLVDATLPVGVVLTIAAAGSEMSKSAVLVHDGEKIGYDSDFCRPEFSILDPELTMTLSDYQTACGCVDIMMHTMERYFSGGTTMEITDSISEALLRTVLIQAVILHTDPLNYEARAEVMWAGSLAHNDLTGCGNEGSDFATHMLEGQVSGRFDTTHGAGLAAIWGSWARYVYRDCLDRFRRFAVNVMGIEDSKEPEETALKGIAAMEDFFRNIGIPTSFAEMGIAPTDEELADMAKSCSAMAGGIVGAAKVLHESDILAIYKAARG